MSGTPERSALPTASFETRIHTYLRGLARRHGDHRSGPFTVMFDPHDPGPYVNYAVPDLGAQPSPAEIEGLVAAFADRGCRARLEYPASTAPAVEPALLAAGFTVEQRFPAMVCPPDRFTTPPAPRGVELLGAVSPDPDEEVFRVALAAQHEAYDAPPPTRHDLDRQRRTVQAGGMVVAARCTETGQPVGGGLCTGPSGSVTELAGIGVRAPWRGRGVAPAMTAELTRLAWASGLDTVFLTPGAASAERAYARVGYVRVGEVLHIGR